MRELKFRFWYSNDKTKELRHSEFTLSQCMNSETFDYFDGPHVGVWYMEDWEEQFTGLHDKNGKEIYEGDIVAGPTIVKPGAVIQWVDICAGWSMGPDWPVSEWYENTEIEVIGNIHENPELLK